MSFVQDEAESNARSGEVLTGVLRSLICPNQIRVLYWLLSEPGITTHRGFIQDEAESNARGGEVLTRVLRVLSPSPPEMCRYAL